MPTEKFVTRPDGKKVNIPGNLVPEAEEFVSTTVHRATKEFVASGYGHAAMGIAAAALAAASNNESPERQKQFLRSCALEIIDKFGPNIIPFLRDELKLALTDEDLRSQDLK